jgi:hypothetical protein
MDVHNANFFKLVKEEWQEWQVKSEEKMDKHLAELEIKWEQKWQLRQNTGQAEQKVADVVGISATTEAVVSDQMETRDIMATCVLTDRSREKIKEEEATGEDAGVTYTAGLGTIFSLYGNPFVDGLWEPCELSLTDGGWFDEESRQIDQMIQDSVYQFSTNCNTVIAHELQVYQQQAADLARGSLLLKMVDGNMEISLVLSGRRWMFIMPTSSSWLRRSGKNGR